MKDQLVLTEAPRGQYKWTQHISSAIALFGQPLRLVQILEPNYPKEAVITRNYIYAATQTNMIGNDYKRTDVY